MQEVLRLSRQYSRRLLLTPALLLLFVPMRSADAQCEEHWLPGDAVPGVNGVVYALAHWDPDGPGPVSRRVVMGGSFSAAGNAVANNIATFDPSTGAWAAFEQGVNSRVTSIAADENGDLFVGGWFTDSSGVGANQVARWNGQWESLGSGTNGRVLALLSLGGGQLIAGGEFTTAGGTPCANIARWNGSSWSPLGAGCDGPVNALALLPSGDVVAGGNFSAPNDGAGIVRWNGSSWSGLGLGLNGVVRSLAVASDGNLYVGGNFGGSGSVVSLGVIRWSQSSGTWSSMGGGVHGDIGAVFSLAVVEGGDVIAGGRFTLAGSTPARYLARWSPSTATWSPLGSGVTGATASVGAYALLGMPNGNVLCGGEFTSRDARTGQGITLWNGSTWSGLSTGFDDVVYSVAALPNGDVVAGGAFTSAGAIDAGRIAVRRGELWTALGSGMNATVWSVLALNDGQIIAGGDFTTAGGVSASHVARWNGSAWTPMGNGIGGPAYALCVANNGDIFAGGAFQNAGGLPARNVARWNGTEWVALGGGVSAPVYSLFSHPNGELIAGGPFTNGVVRWNGTSWASLFGLGDVADVFVMLPNGDLIAGGRFPGHIRKLDSSGWTLLGGGLSGNVFGLTVTANGELVAANPSTSGGQRYSLWRYEENGWAELSGSMVNGQVQDLVTLPNGDVLAGGQFTVAGAQVASRVAQWSRSCHCSADLDDDGSLANGASRDEAVTIEDLLFMLAAFEAGDINADLDNDGEPTTGTPDGAVTIEDLIFFLARFENGC